MDRGGNYQNNSYMYTPNNMEYMNNKRTSDTLAIISLIVGIVAMVGFCCLGGFLGIIGIILGIIALTDNLCNKRALAIIGIVLSSFAFVFTLFVLMLGDITSVMPDVTGMSYLEARSEISDVASDVDFETIEEYSDTVEDGYVIKTIPKAETEIDNDEVVTLYVSKGKQLIMPDIIGMNITQAEEILNNLGFELYITEEYSESAIDTVISAEYSAGYELNDVSGSIDVTVSKGSKEQEIQTLKENAQSVSYEDLLRYPESHKTKPIQIEITVTKLEAQTFLGITYDTAIWATLGGEPIILYDNREIKEPALVEGDIVTIYGYGDGTTTIDTKQKEYQGSLLFGFSYDKTVDSYELPCVSIEHVEF